MYSRKTFILIAIATFFAVSCSKSIEYETFTYCQEGSQTDVNVNINIYVKVPKAGQSVALDSVRAAMTDFFAKNCSTDLQKCLEAYVEEIKDNAGVDMSFPDDEMALLFDYYDSIDIFGTSPYLFQYFSHFYEYDPGALHGLYASSYYVFDATTGHLLKTVDIFNDQQQIDNLLKQVAEEEGYDLSEPTSLTANNNFRLTNDSIIFTYNIYEIASYADGEIELALSKNDIKPYVKQQSPVYKFWY